MGKVLHRSESTSSIYPLHVMKGNFGLVALVVSLLSADRWHQCLDHLHSRALDYLCKSMKVFVSCIKTSHSVSCVAGKFQCLPFNSSYSRASFLLVY